MILDLIFLGVVLAFGFLGLRSGALKQLKHALGMLAAYLGARPLAAYLTPSAAPELGLSPFVVNVLLSIVLFCVLYSLTSWIARRLLAKIFPNRQNGTGDRAFGFVAGTTTGLVLLYALLSFLLFLEKPLTRAFGAPPPAVSGSVCVDFVRRHDLFTVVPVPAVTAIEKLIEAAKNPEAANALLQKDPEIRRLLDDPQLKAMLQDDDLGRELKAGNFSALKNDPHLEALLKNSKLLVPPADEPR